VALLKHKRVVKLSSQQPGPHVAHRFDVLTMGRSSIDLYAHQIGVPITSVTSFDAYVGGCPTNIAVGVRRLGLRSALLTAVGDDQVGDFVLNFLNREDVDVSATPRKRGKRTSAVVLTIQPPDAFPLTFYREGCADRELSPEDVDRAPLAESAIVVLTGTGLSHEPARAATMYAARRARCAARSGIPRAPDRRSGGRFARPSSMRGDERLDLGPRWHEIGAAVPRDDDCAGRVADARRASERPAAAQPVQESGGKRVAGA